MIDVWNIQSALRQHLLTVPDLPVIAWENVPFEPSDDQAWLRETFFPPTERISANNEVEGVGLLILDYLSPLGASVKEAREFIDELKKAFKPTTVLNDLVRIDAVSGQKESPSGAWVQYPIHVSYTVFSTNQ